MAAESMDRRVRKTRRQLRECLVALLKEKKVQDITVRELTDMADINRGTFYLHYRDVFDLLEKTENELLGEFNRVMQEHDMIELKDRPSPIFLEIYTLAYENADLVEILLGDNGDLNFLNRLKQLVREKCLNDWINSYCPRNSAAFESFVAFIVSGCLGMVQYWFQNGLKETPEQLAKLTEHIITLGLGALDTAPYTEE